MSSVPVPRLTAAEYLALERQSATKHEFYRGEMFAMAGASRLHNLIVANLVREISAHLRGGPCEVYPSDMRVKVEASGLYVYPDLVVVCDPPRFEDAQVDTLVNPTLVIEVLSASTERYDRGVKAEHYRRIESLTGLVFVSTEAPHVEQLTRQADGQWLLSEASGRESTLVLPALHMTLRLADVYDKVTFDAPLGAEGAGA